MVALHRQLKSWKFSDDSAHRTTLAIGSDIIMFMIGKKNFSEVLPSVNVSWLGSHRSAIGEEALASTLVIRMYL